MSKSLISQIWKEYRDTGDKRLLADAVRYADFGNNPQIQEEICAILLKSAGKRSDYDQKVRDTGLFISHYLNMNSGLNAANSYKKICSKMAKDEKALKIEEDALRKAISKVETRIVSEHKKHLKSKLTADESIREISRLEHIPHQFISHTIQKSAEKPD